MSAGCSFPRAEAAFVLAAAGLPRDAEQGRDAGELGCDHLQCFDPLAQQRRVVMGEPGDVAPGMRQAALLPAPGRRAARIGPTVPGEAVLSRPMIGIAFCCARAAAAGFGRNYV